MAGSELDTIDLLLFGSASPESANAFGSDETLFQLHPSILSPFRRLHPFYQYTGMHRLHAGTLGQSSSCSPGCLYLLYLSIDHGPQTQIHQSYTYDSLALIALCACHFLKLTAVCAPLKRVSQYMQLSKGSRRESRRITFLCAPALRSFGSDVNIRMRKLQGLS